MKLRSAKARLTVVNVLLIATFTLGITIATYFWVRADLLGSIDAELQDRSMRYLGLRVDGRLVMTQLEAEDSPAFTVPVVPYRPRMFSSDWSSLTQVADAPFPMGGKSFATVQYQGANARVYSRTLRNGRTLQFVYPLTDTDRALAGITRGLFFMGPIGVILAWLVGLAVTIRTLSPVETMAKEASEIQSSTLQKRLPVEGTDELGRLARTFNELLDRIEIAYRKLEENYEIQTRFTANASHELRTPLTVIRGRAELALSSATTVDQFQKSMQIVLNSAQSMSTLVEDLLLLARSDAGHLLPNKKYVDICRIFEEATIGVTDRHIEFHYGVTWVLADSDQLIRVISNLVLNAQRHTSTGGTINLRTWKGEGGVNLSVTDDGEGISENHLQHIFERFYRADASRGHSNGSGLGLAICQEIVEAHGGNIKVGALQDRGLQFTVFLPDNGKVDFEPKTGE